MRHSFHALAFALAGAALVAPLMAAHAGLINDGGFETTQLSNGGYDYVSGTLNNWTYTGHAVLINVGNGNSPWVTTDQTGYGGDQVAGIQQTGSIAQTFTASYTGTYTVSWLDAGRSFMGGSGSQTYIAGLYDNTTASAVASLSLNTATDTNFKAENFSGLLNAGDSYTLTFTGQDTADQTALIDNVAVNQVPEPATLILFGTGLAGLGWTRRRKAI